MPSWLGRNQWPPPPALALSACAYHAGRAHLDPTPTTTTSVSSYHNQTRQPPHNRSNHRCIGYSWVIFAESEGSWVDCGNHSDVIGICMVSPRYGTKRYGISQDRIGTDRCENDEGTVSKCGRVTLRRVDVGVSRTRVISGRYEGVLCLYPA